MTAADITNAITRNGTPFSRRQWIAVPNVSWGWQLHYEADLIAVSKAMRVNEIEVKIDRQDLINDIRKSKWTRGLDARIHKFWYAVPIALANDALSIELPDGIEAGVLAVWDAGNGYDYPRVKIVRAAKPRRDCRKATEKEVTELCRLGLLRYWDLRLKGLEK